MEETLIIIAFLLAAVCGYLAAERTDRFLNRHAGGEQDVDESRNEGSD